MFHKTVGQTYRHQVSRSFRAIVSKFIQSPEWFHSVLPVPSFSFFFSRFQSVSPGRLSSTGAQVRIINRLYNDQTRLSGLRTEAPSSERATGHSLAAIQPPKKKKKRALFNLPSYSRFVLVASRHPGCQGRQFFALIVTRLFAVGVTFCLWVVLMGCK